jgi:biotin-(acetyl-CoA carboxylase) ligase
LVIQVHQQYKRLRQGQWAAIREQYYRCLYRFQQWHDFYDARGRQFRGWIRGVSEQGELLLLDKNQKEHAFSLKEITFQAD